MSELPGLSVILATDAFSTIEPVVRRLRAQSVAEKLELVIVTPRPEALRREAADPGEFAGLLIVAVDGLVPLTAARAAGVRAATAPVVFVGETHTYPEEGWAEALIDAHADDWAAVVPGFGKANPLATICSSNSEPPVGDSCFSRPPASTTRTSPAPRPGCSSVTLVDS